MSQPGSDPYDDVSVHKVPVMRADVDLLLAEVIALGGREEVTTRYGLFYYGPPSFRRVLASLHPLPPVDELAGDLVKLRDELLGAASAGGWEVDRLLSEAREGR